MSDIPSPLEFVDPDETDLNTTAEFTWREVARFWSKVDQHGIGDCWEWRGVPTDAGYGQFWLRTRCIGAHRFACALANGPAHGLDALHACDNPVCVNPAHLRWGTKPENVQDRVGRERSAHGSRQGRARLTEDDVLAIRERAAAGEQKAALGRSFGVTKQAIASIVTRKTWRHV